MGYRVLIGQCTCAGTLASAWAILVAIYSGRDLKEARDKKDEKEDALVPDDYEIAGIFDVGYFEYNANLIVISLVTAQELYDMGDGVNGLRVMLHDPDLGSQVRRDSTRAIGQ